MSTDTSVLGRLEEPVDVVDAGVFSGVSLYNWEALAAFEYRIACWQIETDRIRQIMRADPDYYGKEPK